MQSYSQSQRSGEFNKLETASDILKSERFTNALHTEIKKRGEPLSILAMLNDPACPVAEQSRISKIIFDCRLEAGRKVGLFDRPKPEGLGGSVNHVPYAASL